MNRQAAKASVPSGEPSTDALAAFVPEPFRDLKDPSRDLPRLAKDARAMVAIESAVARVPTRHRLLRGDARRTRLPVESVHLVLTSPPYWTLKEYRRSKGQLGWIEGLRKLPRTTGPNMEHVPSRPGPGGSPDLRGRRCLSVAAARIVVVIR